MKIASGIFFFFILSAGLYAASYTCSTVPEIQNALSSVSPGGTIVINPGTYAGTLQSINAKKCNFGSETPGTENAPVTIKSASAADKAVIAGADPAGNYVFYLYNAGYWIIRDLEFTGSQKGIVLDKSCNTQIINCKVYNIGMEGVHIRDGSSNCRIEQSLIYETGKNTTGSFRCVVFTQAVLLICYYNEFAASFA